jgi:hypothetical protein
VIGHDDPFSTRNAIQRVLLLSEAGCFGLLRQHRLHRTPPFAMQKEVICILNAYLLGSLVGYLDSIRLGQSKFFGSEGRHYWKAGYKYVITDLVDL